jgi:hypothetical protein
VYCHVEAARLDLVEAEWAGQSGRAVRPYLEAALASARRAIELDGKFAPARLIAAEACLRIAKAEPSRDIIELGIGYSVDALARNSQLADARRVHRELLQLRAP